jgi:hypothetical protein
VLQRRTHGGHIYYLRGTEREKSREAPGVDPVRPALAFKRMPFTAHARVRVRRPHSRGLQMSRRKKLAPPSRLVFFGSWQA